jgi:hypothetical protein
MAKVTYDEATAAWRGAEVLTWDDVRAQAHDVAIEFGQACATLAGEPNVPEEAARPDTWVFRRFSGGWVADDRSPTAPRMVRVDGDPRRWFRPTVQSVGAFLPALGILSEEDVRDSRRRLADREVRDAALMLLRACILRFGPEADVVSEAMDAVHAVDVRDVMAEGAP